jgi:glucose-1-phosphate thymidylyltransferase
MAPCELRGAVDVVTRMAVKGLVYLPGADRDECSGENSGLGQVANRPLAGLILGELAAAGVDSLAVVAAAGRIEALRACIASDAARELDVSFLELTASRHLVRAAGEFVGDDAVILHLATGMLAQSCEPLVAGAREQNEELRLFLHHGHEGCGSLSARTERLLGVSTLGSPGGHLSLAGVAVFRPGAFADAARGSGRGPDPSDAADVTEPGHELIAIADELAGQGLTVAAGLVSGWHECSADPSSLLELNRTILDRQARSVRHHAGSNGNRIEGRVVIHETADVSGSVILGPSLIGPGARIADAYIGPYTTVGAGAVIENCEVLRSIVGPGARLSHVGGRIEGSTIGGEASIFRDFRLPRAMRLHVGEGVEISLS